MMDRHFPMTEAQVAADLHCSLRWLRGHRKKHGLARRAGRAINYFEDDYALLVETLPCPSNSYNAGKSGTCAAPSQDRVSMKLRELLTQAKPRNTAKSDRRNSGTVVSMVKRRR